MNDTFCLYGASGHGKVVKDVIESQKFTVIAFFDDDPKDIKLLDVPVLNKENIKYYLSEKYIISIGDNFIRKKISQNLKVNFSKILHQSANIAATVEIELGTVVMGGVHISADSIIGKHCILNTSSVIEHDCIIDDFVHVSPNATLCGGVKVGEGTHIGAGATIIPNLTIGKWVTIGAGSIITKNIPDFAVVVGNPGKIIKYNRI